VMPAIQGYPDRLRAMIKGLVDNAIEAMNQKGRRERELSIATVLDEAGIEVRIEDTGPGVPTQLRLKAFEPFYSTKKGLGAHLGTGLSAAQQVAADHGGSIGISEGQRQGCLVTVSLPLRRD
jgi:nitrogen fixation regulatory protein